MYSKFIFYILLIAILSACNNSFVKKAPMYEFASCTNETSKYQIIKWGNYLSKKDKLLNGYMLKPNGIIYRLENIEDTTGKPIINIADSIYCENKKNLEQTILKYQILNVFADTSRFIFVENPKTKYVFRAFWNPNYFDKNLRNIDFSAIYSKYMLELPEEEILKVN